MNPKIEEALRRRSNYDATLHKHLTENLKNPAALNESIDLWFAAENALTPAEYAEYQRIYRERTKP